MRGMFFVERGRAMAKDNPVRLPEQWEAHTVSSMMPGDERWAPGWAMLVDLEGFCWLDPEAPVFFENGADFSAICVIRESDGYIVLVPTQCTFRWFRIDPSEEDSDEGEEDSEESENVEFIPVYEFREIRSEKKK